MRKWEQYSEEELKKIYEQFDCKTDFIQALGYKRGSHVSENFNLIKEKYSWCKEYPTKKAWNREDLVGKRFGRLIVIEDMNKKQNNHELWLCKCDCGNTTIVSTNRLLSGNTTSCGCYKKEVAKENGKKNLIDITGQSFGLIEVIERVGTNEQGQAVWKCKCLKCNSIIEKPLDSYSIRHGRIKSCGCIKSNDISSGEYLIFNLLNLMKEKYNFTFIHQYSFSDLKGSTDKLRFDFVIFKEKQIYVLIEYNGEQHYEIVEYFGGKEKFLKQQENDNKNENTVKSTI